MLQNTSQGHKEQANPSCDPGTKYNSPNYNATTSYDRQTKSGWIAPHPCLTLPKQHTTPLTLPPHQLITTPHPLRKISPLIRLPFHCTLPTTPCYPLYNRPILNPYSIPSSSLNICTRTPNTLSYFSPHSHPTSIKYLNTQDGYQRMTHRGTTANDHNIFLRE